VPRRHDAKDTALAEPRCFLCVRLHDRWSGLPGRRHMRTIRKDARTPIPNRERCWRCAPSGDGRPLPAGGRRGAGGIAGEKRGVGRVKTFCQGMDATALHARTFFCRIGALGKAPLFTTHQWKQQHGTRHFGLGQMQGWITGRKGAPILDKSGEMNDYPYGFAAASRASQGSSRRADRRGALPPCFTMAAVN